jgi:hypothetical protein
VEDAEGNDPDTGKLSDYVSKIVVDLHPTFHPNKIVLTEEPYAFTRVRQKQSLFSSNTPSHIHILLPFVI